MTSAGTTGPQRHVGAGGRVVPEVGRSDGRQHGVFGCRSRLARPPVRGTWERYEFRVGTWPFLMMSDRNEPTQMVGRASGGNPGGVVTGETFGWWQRRVEAHRDGLVLSAHHYMLKDTNRGLRRVEGVKDWTLRQPDMAR